MTTFVWSVRRELWEHRWVYRVPVLVGGAFTLVFAAVMVAGTGNADLSAQAAAVGNFDLVSRLLLMTGTIVAFVYCAEALHGERRDNSIQFWRALPVGDGVAVAAKVTIPLCIIPLATLVMLLLAQIVAHAVAGDAFRSVTTPLANPGAAVAEVVASALWIAPVYCWILMVSAWARRAVLVVALVPPVLAGMVGHVVTGSGRLADALFLRGVGRHWPAGVRLGSAPVADAVPPRTAPELLVSPALWLGVLLAIALVTIAVRLRGRQVSFI